MKDVTKDYNGLQVKYEKYTFLEQMLQGYHNYVTRNGRFVVTGPIAIAIAIGLFSGTGAVAASITIAREEGNRISREQNILRNIDSQVALANNLKNNNISIELGKVADFQKYLTALSAQTSVNYHNAEDLKHKIVFMLNKSKVLTFSDPEIEQWFTAIKEVITNNTKGITKSEMKEATRLTAGLTLMTTSLLPLKPNSNKCEDAMLLKTLVIPVVRFNSSKTFIL